jgi:hypothetical protein
MKKLLLTLSLPLFVFISCADDDDDNTCNEAVDIHAEALETFEDIQALYGTDGFEGDESYVSLCESLADFAEAGLDECPSNFSIYEDWTAEDFADFREACIIYGP